MVECMGEIPYFSKLLTEMTGVGERSGSMEETLEIVGDYFSNEVDLRSQRLLSALGADHYHRARDRGSYSAAGRISADVRYVRRDVAAQQAS